MRIARLRTLAFLASGYVLLLGLSWAVQTSSSREPPTRQGERRIRLPALDGAELTGDAIGLAFRELGPAGAPALVLLHGSPGSVQDFDSLAAKLAGDRHVLVPDLPGFGHSTRELPDYSSRTHGRYLLALLDQLGVARAHLVGFSMGGAVALSAADLAPARVASITLVASIGVQEFELLGSYHLNRLVHALQLGAVWTLEKAVPHMGLLEHSPLGIPYARNFFDSDQRPLRAILERYRAPMLIIHGRSDLLVPMAAALEHQRLVPQSELELLQGGHLLLFRDSDQVKERLLRFVRDVESGRARTRARAAPERVARAQLPFDRSQAGPQGLLGFLAFFLLVFAASMVSEDLTCIGAGMLVGAGQIGFPTATLACVVALFAGDLLLYVVGRVFGRAALSVPGLSRVAASGLDRTAARLRASGGAVILASRFLPGTRLVTYLAAGVTRYPVTAFACYLLIAALLWTPVLVGFSALVGTLAFESFAVFERYALPAVLGLAIAVLLTARCIVPLWSFRGRRLLLGSWRRLTRFEFWPMWVFYPPVALWIAALALRHRSLLVVTSVNPAIEGGGLVGESKWRILQGLSESAEFVARGALLARGSDRLAQVFEFLAENGARFPVVLKPDVGERGRDVEIVRNRAQLEAYLGAHPPDSIVQEYVPGAEFGIFYYRHPDSERGEILSITEKRMLEVVGDGRRTLEELILLDPRAVCMAPRHLTVHQSRLDCVLPPGEVRRLTEVGTHSLGALFLDGGWAWSTELADRFDRISRAYTGFFFGRYDVRAPDLAAFRLGHAFRIVELNGLTSEATHIYDPKNSLFEAYRVLFHQWQIAFEIGAANRARGHEPLGFREGLRLVLRR